MDDKASIAARAILSNIDKKIMSFQELKQITKTFGIELSTDEKYKFISKSRNHKPSIIRRRDGGFLSSYCKDQRKIDDFMRESGFLGKNRLKRERKNHVFKNDSLLENDDSLVDFFIRMYWSRVPPKIRLNLSKSD